MTPATTSPPCVTPPATILPFKRPIFPVKTVTFEERFKMDVYNTFGGDEAISLKFKVPTFPGEFYVVATARKVQATNEKTITFRLHGDYENPFFQSVELEVVDLYKHSYKDKCSVTCPYRVAFFDIHVKFTYMDFREQVRNHRDRLAEYFENPDTCDVTFIVDESTIKAHKCILGARSPVFRTMFTNESFIEARTSSCQIHNHTPETVRAMVKFCYTDDIAVVEDNVEDLFRLADEYDITDLRHLCENKMIENVNNDNVLDRLDFARSSNAQRLHDYCVFVASNCWQHHRDTICSEDDDIIEAAA